jgi:hypothetical protein
VSRLLFQVSGKWSERRDFAEPCSASFGPALLARSKRFVPQARPQADCRFNGLSSIIWVLVFPSAHHVPPGFGELRIGVRVSALVCLDLVAPPLRVLLWPRAVFGAAVPEAPVNEDRDAKLWKGDVGCSPKARDPIVNSESKPVAMQTGSDRNLGRRVALTLRLHPTQGVW